MPRWQAHLFHLFPSLLRDLLGMDPYLLSSVFLPPLFGALCMLALMGFVREVAGRDTALPLVFMAILAPVTLLALHRDLDCL